MQEQIKLAPNTAHYHHQLAEVYLISGRKESANKTLDNILENFPEFIPSYILKGRQLLESGDLAAAEQFFKNATKMHEKVAELWIDNAKLYLNNNKPETATEILVQAVKINNSNPYLVYELATHYDERGMPLKSEPLYLKILQNYPEYLPALDNLASNYFLLNKDLSHAVVLAKRAFMLAPNDPFIINLRAQAHLVE